MKAAHVMLAILVAAIWGFAFVATELALDSFSPPQLAAIRFLIAALPIVFLPRPTISWLWLVMMGLFLFTGQFLLLFFGMVHGMPPGLASITMQMQAFFTICIAAVALRDVPTVRQFVGVGVAVVGLILIAGTVGGDLTYLGLGLTLAGALSWAVGNVLVKRLGPVDMLSLIVWLSIVPPLPALALSALVDDGPSLFAVLMGASWTSLMATLYLGVVATIFAYAVWGHLLRLYATALVAPFALLAPCTGLVSAAIVFGERFGPLRALGMVLILIGLVTTVVSPQSWAVFRSALGRVRATR